MSPIVSRCVLLLTALLIQPAVVWSHPGPGHEPSVAAGSGWVHYLVSPDHFVPIAASVMVLTILAMGIAHAIGSYVRQNVEAASDAPVISPPSGDGRYKA